MDIEFLFRRHAGVRAPCVLDTPQEERVGRLARLTAAAITVLIELVSLVDEEG
ncbi:hypothetical protein PO883_00350 [Massilia sp. DJPM01]|uniref:hypothetical protein n=1 Tax=Massilia sp. DJPM01 TaxID=3024404 RepID=UPI00259D4ACB|nr:hypothetical protein [Massilia sp. DJPM01]MDM5175661.1 hypothetical protein [Massilia sp. DJPM01]